MQQVRTWYGIFSVENGVISSCDLYPRDARSLAERLQETPSALKTSEVCGCDIRTLAKEWGFVDSDQEYDELFHEVNIEYTLHTVAAAKTDEHVLIRHIEAVDDLDRIINALSERIKELYDLNFPELGLKGEPLVRFISDHGVRQSTDIWKVDDKQILKKAEGSMGIELPQSCAGNLKDMAQNIAGLYRNRDRLSDYVDTYMNDAYPNLSDVAGTHIGARLISIAGSGERLASMPSSTIQVLGAAKALFKHLRGNAPPPKHGVIFQHPLINQSPWWLRGKLARVLASRISLAVRVDYYSGDYRPAITRDLDRKVAALRRQYPAPPGKKRQ